MSPPIEKLRELFDYAAATGALTWRARPREDFSSEGQWRSWNTRFEDKPAGCHKSRYVQVSITLNDVLHQLFAHRVIWAIVHGCWPSGEIDHRNGNGLDNRIANLREATHRQNYQNLRLKPVGFDKARGRFCASIRINGKKVSLGRFATAEEAHAAYLAAKAKHHTFQPVPREMVT